VTVEITGRLNALLGEQAYPNRVRGVWGKMVAEEDTSNVTTQFFAGIGLFVRRRL